MVNSLLPFAISFFCLTLISCNEEAPVPQEESTTLLESAKNFDLIFNQETNIGKVEISNDNEYLYFEYDVLTDWQVNEIQVYLGSIGDLVDKSEEIDPKTFQFSYICTKTDSNCTSLKIPLKEIKVDCNQLIAHARVSKSFDNGDFILGSAWSFGTTISDESNSVWYNEYCIKKSSIK